MRVGRALLAAVAALALLVAAATLAAFTLDLGVLGHPLTRWASDKLQRPLAIDGRVSIRAGRTLRLSAERIRLGNTPWGSRPDMLLVSRLTVEVDAASLFRRPVIVRRIELDGLDLLLERRADGANNWAFGPDTPEDESAWPEELPLVVERVSLPGSRIRFNGPRLDRTLDLRFGSLEQRRAAGSMLELTGRGTANGEPIELEGRAGPFAALVAGRDFGLAFEGRFGELLLGLNLRMDDLARPVNTTLVLKVRGPNADYLASRFGVRNLGSGPLVLDGTVRPAGDGTGVTGELTGEVGQFAIRARGELADPTEMRKLRTQLDISGPDLGFAGGLAGLDGLPPEPFRLTADVERAGELFRINGVTLEIDRGRAEVSGTIRQFTALAGNDLRFSFSGADLARFRDSLRLPPGLTGPFDIAGTLKAGGDAELIDVQSTTTLGTLKVSGPLGARPDYYGTRLAFAAAGPSLARAGELAGLGTLPAVDFAGTGDLEWTAKGAMIRQGQLRAGRIQLKIDGLVARQPLGPGTDVTWSASGPDLRMLTAPWRIEGVPAGAFDLRGRLRREPRVSRLDDVRGTVAGASVRLSGRIADQPKSGTTLDLAVDGPRLEAFAGLVPGYELPGGPFRVAGSLAVTPKRVKLGGMRVAAAGAQGTVDADIELPLSAVRGEFLVTARGTDVARFLPRLGSSPSGTANFDLRVRGRAQGGAWQLDEAEFNTPAGRVTAGGRLDWAPDFSATDLTLTVTAADLAALGRLFALDLPAQPLDLTAGFTGRPAAFRAERVAGRLGTTDFDGRLELDLRERPTVDVDFRSELVDLTPYLGEPAPAPATATAAGAPGPSRRRASPRLIPDTPIPLGWLQRFDGSLAVRADRALFATVALDDLRLAARLKNGKLVLETLELKASPDGRLTFSGAIGPQARGAALRLSASGTRIRLARLDDTAAVRDARPRADLEMALAGEGATWRELAQSLDGTVRVTTGPGAVPAASMNVLFGGLWRDLVATVVPGMGNRDTTNVRCLAAFITATDGVVRTAPAFVMQTERVNVIAHGSADMRTEQLEFYLSTAPRRGRVDVTVAEIVNPYMKITGSLASPGLGVDPKGVLFSGGAAVATAGISILAKGVWDRMFRADDPCAEAAAEAARLESGEPASRKTLIPRPRSRN
ncbi:MAG: AsmA family protein [Gammaproteobacteria bacterium]|nr:AsmA family protein [Gammaproteobacteria bacterium]